MTSACDVVVSGRVQGVFYRDSCRRRAAELGVRGWVRNEADGTVRGHFEGPADAVAALVAWCRTGPAKAEVRDVVVRASAQTGADRFVIR